jgi:glycine/D-amino acid oxidase-like deaminating enzyme
MAGVGLLLVAVNYALSALAAFAVLATRPDVSTRTGRHLIAGTLALASLAGVEILIALFPLRRGEMWAFWAALLPMTSPDLLPEG